MLAALRSRLFRQSWIFNRSIENIGTACQPLVFHSLYHPLINLRHAWKKPAFLTH